MATFKRFRSEQTKISLTLIQLKCSQKHSFWKPKYFSFYDNGDLYYSKPQKKGETKECYKFDISRVRLEKMDVECESKEIAVKVMCKKDDLPTYFRCLVKPEVIEEFTEAFAKSSVDNNVTEFQATLVHQRSSPSTRSPRSKYRTADLAEKVEVHKTTRSRFFVHLYFCSA